MEVGIYHTYALVRVFGGKDEERSEGRPRRETTSRALFACLFCFVAEAGHVTDQQVGGQK